MVHVCALWLLTLSQSCTLLGGLPSKRYVHAAIHAWQADCQLLLPICFSVLPKRPNRLVADPTQEWSG